VRLGDINGDGKPDLMIVDGMPDPDDPNPPPPTVTTWYGDGNGSFLSLAQLPYPGPIASAVLWDVNNDGELDIVSNSVVILANPAGGYKAPIPLSVPNAPNTCEALEGAISVGDINTDGFPDIVTANCEDDTVTVYLNEGSGNFQAGVSHWSGYFTIGIDALDLNGDGKADIVCSNRDGSDLTVLMGNGDGTLQPVNFGYSAGGLVAYRPLLHDFNADGNVDALLVNTIADLSFGLSLIPGVGGGAFASAIDYFSPHFPEGSAHGESLAIADFNSDGRPDIVLGNSSQPGSGVTVFLNSQAGSIGSGANYGVTGDLNYVGTGDFNGDGTADIIATELTTGSLELFAGNGDGTFQTAQVFTAGSYGGFGIGVADFNGDGKLDIALLDGEPSVVILLNNGAGGFQAPLTHRISNQAYELRIADINGDGKPDIIAAQSGLSLISVLLGNGDGSFQTLPDFDSNREYPGGLAVGDLNGDGTPDLAITIDDSNLAMGVAVALGNGDGTFQPAVLYPSSSHISVIDQPYPAGIAIVDINKDGSPDLVYSNSVFGTVGVLCGNGDGTFAATLEYPAGGFPYGLVAADVNGDGADDVVVSDYELSGITVLLNSSATSLVLGSSPNPVSTSQPLTLTATVEPLIPGVLRDPSGTVTFRDQGAVLGTGLVSARQATISVSSLVVGTHQITADYSGDSGYRAAISMPLIQMVNSPSSPLADYSLGVAPLVATLSPGTSGTFTVTLTPSNGYSNNVTFACNHDSSLTCDLNPTAVAPVGGPVQLRLTVTAQAGTQITGLGRHSGVLGSLFCTLLFAACYSGRQRFRWLRLIFVALFLPLSMGGCGGTSQSLKPSASTSHVVSVLGTGAGANGANLVRQTSVTIQIQ